MTGSRKLAVLGAGSWGTALALAAARNGVDTRLWGLAEDIPALKLERENRRYLAGVLFPETLHPTSDLVEACDDAEILIAVPSAVFVTLVRQLRTSLAEARDIAWATKGLEPSSGDLLSHSVEQVMPDCSAAVLSGPTFAREVAESLPTALTVAAREPAHAERLAALFHGDRMRVYTSDDLIGVQIGGAVKNVMAIAAGISDGLGFGANARAALITRGLNEITRFGVAQGARAETFMGLTGMGDLVLTCTDNQSRNRRMGLALAAGESMEQARQRIGQAVEGVDAAREVYHRSRALGVDMPISEQVFHVLYSGLDPRLAVNNLLERSQKVEAPGS